MHGFHDAIFLNAGFALAIVTVTAECCRLEGLSLSTRDLSLNTMLPCLAKTLRAKEKGFKKNKDRQKRQ